MLYPFIERLHNDQDRIANLDPEQLHRARSIRDERDHTDAVLVPEGTATRRLCKNPGISKAAFADVDLRAARHIAGAHARQRVAVVIGMDDFRQVVGPEPDLQFRDLLYPVPGKGPVGNRCSDRGEEVASVERGRQYLRTPDDAPALRSRSASGN